MLLWLPFDRTAGPSSPPSSPGEQTSPSRTTGTAPSRRGSAGAGRAARPPRAAGAVSTAPPPARRRTPPSRTSSRWSSPTRRAPRQDRHAMPPPWPAHRRSCKRSHRWRPAAATPRKKRSVRRCRLRGSRPWRLRLCQRMHRRRLVMRPVRWTWSAPP